MKQLTFSQWLRATKPDISVLKCTGCYGGKGYFFDDNDEPHECLYCAKDDALAELEKEYSQQAEADRKILENSVK